MITTVVITPTGTTICAHLMMLRTAAWTPQANSQQTTDCTIRRALTKPITKPSLHSDTR